LVHDKVAIALVADKQGRVTVGANSGGVLQPHARRTVVLFVAQLAAERTTSVAVGERLSRLGVIVRTVPHLVIVVGRKENTTGTVLHVGNVGHLGVSDQLDALLGDHVKEDQVATLLDKQESIVPNAVDTLGDAVGQHLRSSAVGVPRHTSAGFDFNKINAESAPRRNSQDAMVVQHFHVGRNSNVVVLWDCGNNSTVARCNVVKACGTSVGHENAATGVESHTVRLNEARHTRVTVDHNLITDVDFKSCDRGR
jgi:hypothetical protein